MNKLKPEKSWQWFQSIKIQVLAILVIQFAALLSIVLTSLYLVNLRQHDYVILNLTGQLRVLNNNMITQAKHYSSQVLKRAKEAQPNLHLFRMDLMMQVAAYDRIIQALKKRSIDADLVQPQALRLPTGGSEKIPSLAASAEPIVCKWDAPSRAQMDRTAEIWDRFHAGLDQRLNKGDSANAVGASADYIVANEITLTNATARLANTFRRMMEIKLGQIQLLNDIAIGIIITISLTIITILYRRVFRPIDRTVAGFQRVARGELGYRIPVEDRSEIGAMTSSFNDLARRLSTLFRLSDRINDTDNVDDTLRYVYEFFPVFFPVHWVGLLRSARNNREYHIDRSYCESTYTLDESERFPMPDSLFADTASRNLPYYSNVDNFKADPWHADAFIRRLHSNGLKSVFYLPISSNPLETAVLVLATETFNAYNADHLEFLTNIAGQVARSFEKTIGMESLVITSIKGLANLAESRDPETGDHLFRMSHYSALIAEELAGESRYAGYIDQHYIRDILRFSPMHDIGKVGIADDILLKRGKLNDEQIAVMQRHPQIGADVLRRCEEQMNAVGRSVFRIGIEITECHHEKYDGSGYPNKLKGDDIPLSARIVAAADVFDALTSKRPYKEAWPIDRAISHMEAETGKHFDPDVVAACLRAMPRIRDIYDKYKHV